VADRMSAGSTAKMAVLPYAALELLKTSGNRTFPNYTS